MRGVTPKLASKSDLRVVHYKGPRATCQQELELSQFKSRQKLRLESGLVRQTTPDIRAILWLCTKGPTQVSLTYIRFYVDSDVVTTPTIKNSPLLQRLCQKPCQNPER